MDVGEFCQYLDANGRSEVLKAAFAVVERFLAEGDMETKQIAEIGILEALQSGGRRRAYIKFLGPQAHPIWSELEMFAE